MEIMALDVVGIALTVLASVLYGVVAVFLQQRKVSKEARGAQWGFVLWWGGLAILGIYGLIFNDTYGLSLISLGLTVSLVVIYIIIGALYVMLGGLMYYMVYLYTGSAKWRTPIIVFYVLMMVFFVWWMHSPGVCVTPDNPDCIPPPGTDPDARQMGSLEERPAWLGAIFGLLLVVPPLGSAVMYFLLFFRVRDVTSKYRVAAISGGIILWFGFSAVNSIVGISSSAGAGSGQVSQLVSQALGLFAAVLVLAAYFPPKFVQNRWGVHSITQESDPQS